MSSWVYERLCKHLAYWVHSSRGRIKKIEFAEVSREGKRRALTCRDDSARPRGQWWSFLCDGCGFVAEADFNANINMHGVYW